MDQLEKLKELINSIFKLENITEINNVEILSFIDGLFNQINEYFINNNQCNNIIKNEVKSYQSLQSLAVFIII